MTLMQDSISSEAVRLDYLMSLTKLKDTSRPIIVTLTAIAKESSPNHASAIVAAITYHSLHTQYQHKLPVIYLIDSILKTVGGVYTDLFAECIQLIYTNAFIDSTESTRLSLLKVLGTWRCPSPPLKGSIFSTSILDQIDSFVRTVPRPSPTTSTSTSIHSPFMTSSHSPVNLIDSHSNSVLLKQSILNDLTNLISARQSQVHPNVSGNDIKLDTLVQLRTFLVSDKFSPDQLDLVRSTVSQLMSEFLAQSVAAPVANPLNAIVPATTQFPPSTFVPPTSTVPSSSCFPAMLASTTGSSTSSTHLSPFPSPPSSLQGTSVFVPPSIAIATHTVKPKSSLLDISLTSLNPTALAIIYPQHQTKCGQCGLRLSSMKNSDSGDSALDAHMDLHFRQNRKARDTSMCFQSRVWLTSRQAWLTNAETESKTSVPSFFSDSSHQRPDTPPTGNLPTQQLNVPRDSLGVQVPVACAICMERLSTGYSAELDEWVVKEVVVLQKHNNTYVHVACLSLSVPVKRLNNLSEVSEQENSKRINLGA